MHGDNESYFDRLGQMDRLRWLVFEGYMRKNYGVKMIDDTAFQRILNCRNANENISVDPPNFCILQNEHY